MWSSTEMILGNSSSVVSGAMQRSLTET
jgi:hypothetical protein